MSAAGGAPTILIKPDEAVTGYTNPHFLQDGRHFSFFRRTASMSKIGDPAGGSGIYIGSLDSTESKRLLASPIAGTIAKNSKASGGLTYLLFARNGALLAEELDLKAVQLRGKPILIAEAVAIDTFFNFADFSASSNGILAVNTAGQQHQLVLLDRGGKQLGSGTPVSSIAHPSFAPDGNTVIYNQPDPRNGVGEIWRLDLGRNTTSLVTFDSGSDFPVFNADTRSADALRADESMRLDVNFRRDEFVEWFETVWTARNGMGTRFPPSGVSNSMRRSGSGFEC